MKLHFQKIILNKKARGILLITSVLILVLMFTLYHQNSFYYTPQFLTGLSSKDGDFQICYRGEYTIITVRMLNSTDPIIGELTLFYDESNGLLIGGEFTNSSGYAVLNWSIPPDYNLGPTIIKATCPNRPDAIPVYTDLLIKSKTTFENLTYPESVHPEECLVVEANLRDNINAPLPNQSVYLYDYQNNSLNESTTDILGHCKLSWMVPSEMVPGLYKFNIKFEGDQLYESAEDEFNLTIKGKAFFENLTHPASAYPEECLVVEVDLRDNNYSPLFGQNIHLYDYQNNSLNESITDLVGHCTLYWMIPSDTAPGLYSFRVRFDGDQLYESTEDEFNVTIKGKTFFENLTHPASAYPEECLVVEVDLRDNNYSPLSNQSVYLYDCQNSSLAISTTDMLGHCTLYWMIPSDTAPGLYSFRVRFDGSVSYGPTESEFNVTILPIETTKFENLTYPTSAQPGEILVVEANLRNNSNSPLPHQQVHLIDYQNSSLAVSTTDLVGHCTLSWMIPSDTARGLYSFGVRFEGSVSYGPTESEFNVTILPSSLEIVSITLNTTIVEPNMPIFVTVEINYDDLLISVKINDFPLEKKVGATWEGIINASSQTGKHVLSVIVSYNDVQCVNDSSTYYVVEESALNFPVGTLLLFFTNNEGSLTKELSIITPVSAMAIISAIIIWKKRNRQPGFSRDYTLDVDSDSN